MNVFFKNIYGCVRVKDTSLPTDPVSLQKYFNLNPSGYYCLGIDGSTTSFGVALYTSAIEDIHLLMLMRESSETADTFMEKVFPFLQRLFFGITFSIATYERTPDDFYTNTRMVQVMKHTEKSIKNFLHSKYFISIEHTDNIFDIFPVSWKSYIVPSDVLANPGKVNKRENAIAVFQKRGLPISFWLQELDAFSSHSYDCAEALGIGMYGSDFIYNKPFVRVYRDFGRKRPISLLGKLVSEDGIGSEIELLFSQTEQIPFCLYVPNELHSAFENLYALDSDTRLGILLTESASPLRIYLEHIHGIASQDTTSVLISVTFRHNKTSEHIVDGLINHYGYTRLEI